jgi:hypothetical protein
MGRYVSEDEIQRMVFAHLQMRAKPGVIAWHTPQGDQLGGKRTPSGIPLAAIRNKKRGVMPGVSDVLIFYAGRLFALELKAIGGRPTEHQLKFLDLVNAAGGYATWCQGLDKALAILESWGVLKPDRRIP